MLLRPTKPKNAVLLKPPKSLIIALFKPLKTPENFLFDYGFFSVFYLFFWPVMPQWFVSGHPTPTTMPAGHNGKINLRYCWYGNNAAEVKSRVSPKSQS